MCIEDKKLDIKYVNEACDTMQNCNQCVIVYGGHGHKHLIPCNHIRKKYGVSIWSYKAEYRKGL
jgi:hypothetical protein